MSSVVVTNVSSEAATNEVAELVRSFFKFHGTINDVRISGCAMRRAIQYACTLCDGHACCMHAQSVCEN